MRLGPIPKLVVVSERAPSEVLQRIASAGETRVGIFLSEAGNALPKSLVRRLSRLSYVHLFLRPPVLPIHAQMIRDLDATTELTVIYRRGETPQEDLVPVLERAGFGRKNVFLRGAVDPARLAPLRRLKHGMLRVDLPPGGFDEQARALLADHGRAELAVRVPATATAADLRTLEGLGVEHLWLETLGNRLSPEVQAFAEQSGARIHVRLSPDLDGADLAALRKLPRLHLVVWAKDAASVPPSLTELLARSEGESR